MSKNGIVVLTENATQDELTEAQYREIYDELRQGGSLEAFVGKIGSMFSKALWSKFERGEAMLNREQKSELRRAVALKVRPPTVSHAVEEHADPDAQVVKIGDAPATRVLLLDAKTYTIHCAPTGVSLTSPANGAGPHVTRVTRSTRGLSVPGKTYARLDALRRSLGLTWGEMLNRAADKLEQEDARA